MRRSSLIGGICRNSIEIVNVDEEFYVNILETETSETMKQEG